MKVLSIPSSGKCGNLVAYPSRYGQCQRQWVIPTNTQSPAREFMRVVFGQFAQMWGRGLTEAQRDRWNYAGPQVMSHPRLGERGPLTGQQHFEGINCVRARVGLPPVLEPPAPVAFGPTPVQELVMENGENGVRLWLRMSAVAGGEGWPAGEDIMVFGQAPCSAGRHKRRNVSYLGLVGSLAEGLVEITELYKARFGEPRPGTKVFIVTCQQREGWKGQEKVTSEIVPQRAQGFQASAELQNSQKPLMYKGCTRDTQGYGKPLATGLGAAAEGVEGGKPEIRTPKSEGNARSGGRSPMAGGGGSGSG